MGDLSGKGILHRDDGSVEVVPVDIPQDFFRAGQDQLDEYVGSGWQNTDSEHPPGGGQPGYRVAYKTLKVIPSRNVELQWPNLRMVFGAGSLNRGGMRTPDGVAGRSPSHQIVPEFGMRLAYPNGDIRYVGCPDLRLAFAGWEETLGGVFYLEIMYRLPDDEDTSAESVLRTGRAAVAPIKTMLDLIFGARLLGIPLLEEVGEIFDDWHWNRRLDSLSLSTELQLRPEILNADDIIARIKPPLEHNQSATAEKRRRFRLASQWYWFADAELDPVNRFLQLWIVVETLEMDNSNIAPVKARCAALLGGTVATGQFVGRLYGLRSALVHGDADGVTTEHLRQVEVLARSLLKLHMNQSPSEDEIGQLRHWIGTSQRANRDT